MKPIGLIKLLALLIAMTVASPFKVNAEEICGSESVPSKQWSFWKHLQISASVGYNMYGDNVANSLISHLGRDNMSYMMNGVKAAIDLKYNLWESRGWNIYAGVGFAVYHQNFRKNFVYLVEDGESATFKHTKDPYIIEQIENMDMSDFDITRYINELTSGYSTCNVLFPISIAYEMPMFDHALTLIPMVRVGKTTLDRRVSEGYGEDHDVLFESSDKRLNKYVNTFGLGLRLSSVYEGYIGVYVEFGLLPMTSGLKYDAYSCSIGVQLQMSPKRWTRNLL